MRAFAGVKLAGQVGVEAPARERWAAWYGALAEQIWRADSFAPFADEVSNIIDVAMWLLNNNRIEAVSKLFYHTQRYLFANGRWTELELLSEQLAQAMEITPDPVILRLALRTKVNILRDQHRWDEATTWLQRFERIAADLDDEGDHFKVGAATPPVLLKRLC